MKTLKENKILYYTIASICILFMFFGRFIPINGLSQQGVGLIFVFVSTMVLWMVYGLVWPSLLCLVALGFLNYGNFGGILASSFGDQTWVFLLFTFVLSFALVQTPVFKRIALAFVSIRLARTNGHLFIFLFLLAVLIIACFTSPTVLFAIMYPILKEIFFLAKVKKGDKLSKYLMLGMCFTIAIGSGMTTIAHVFPLTAIATAERIIGHTLDISILQYMAFAIPFGLVAFLLIVGTFLLILKKEDTVCLTNVNVINIKNTLPKMNIQELVSIITFLIVVLLWIIPSLLKPIALDFYSFMNTTLGIAIPPLIGCVVLAFVKIGDKPILGIIESMKNNIPWSSLLVCAAALALGAAFEPTGLKTFFEGVFKQAFSNLPGILLLAVLVIWTLLETNFSSNLVTATLVATLATNILQPRLNIDLNFAAVISIIGALSGFAFATPPAHPNTALTVSSGYVNSKQTLGWGMTTAGYSMIAALLIGYPIAMCVM